MKLSACNPVALSVLAADSVMYPGECDSASAELKEAQKAGAELMQDREELSAQLAGLEQQLADMTQAHNDLKCAPVEPVLQCLQISFSTSKLLSYAMLCCNPQRSCSGLCAA